MSKYYVGLRWTGIENKKKECNWIVHCLHMNCLLKGIVEGKIGGGI
jgi:hypothetical protein